MQAISDDRLLLVGNRDGLPDQTSVGDSLTSLTHIKRSRTAGARPTDPSSPGRRLSVAQLAPRSHCRARSTGAVHATIYPEIAYRHIR